MRIVLARLQSLKAVALSNGNDGAAAAIDQMTALGEPIDIQLPEVLVPPTEVTPVPVEVPLPTTIEEAHDAVQAGTHTREELVDAGVIPTVDTIPPPPEPAAEPVPESPTSSEPAVSADAPATSAPEQVTETPAPMTADPVPPVDTAPPASEPATSAPEQVTPPDGDQPAQPDAPPVVGPEVPASDGVQATPVSDGAVTPQSDPADEDPTPADKETVASLDARLDKIERPGKVSRQ